MKPKGTLHAFFDRKAATPTPRRDPLSDSSNAATATPSPALGSSRTAAGGQPTPAGASGKRKADESPAIDLEPRTKEPRTLPTGAEHKKARMQDLLGGGSTKEQKLAAVQDRFAWLDDKNVRDAAGRRPSDAAYDDRTCTVPPAVWQKLSASQRQYWQVKKLYRDVVLFFRVGSFYELYEEDAAVGQEVLGWKLTLTGVGACRQVGCPVSGVDEAVQRLLAAGYKVGRMEQVETAAEAKAARGAKATVRRELAGVLTPATATDGLAADAVTLLALAEAGSSGSADALLGFAFLDAAAARLYVGCVADDAGRANLGAVLTQVAPREVLLPRNALSAATARRLAAPPLPLQLSPTDPGDFPPQLLEQARGGAVPRLPPAQHQELFGALRVPQAAAEAGGGAGLAALAALVSHLRRLRAADELATAEHAVVPFGLYKGALCMDGPTLQNLEVLATADGGCRGSLLDRIDACQSHGGRRLLRRWLCRPLRSIPAIEQRQDAVGELAAAPAAAGELAAQLRRLPDLERLTGRVRNAAAPPSLGAPAWAVAAAQARRLAALRTAADGMRQGGTALASLAEASRREGWAAALLRQAAAAAPGAEAEAVIQQVTRAISHTKAAKGKRASAALNSAVLDEELVACAGAEGSDGRLRAEIAATDRLLAAFLGQAPAWEALEAALSTLDVLCAFACFAACAEGPTCRPALVAAAADGGAVLRCSRLWNPCAVPGGGGSVVPNDVCLGDRDGGARALLLTGPNMGGKSTLLRACCAAQVLAQAGCWVPAAEATLSPADRIFTRLGAADRIVAGESTFLVECSEAAAILRQATPASLVVLDELGRGTGTFDGFAIAEAVLSFLSRRRCRLLFATHYHALAGSVRGDANVLLGHMAADLAGGPGRLPGITFLYKLLPGACPRSHGLQVAQLAGVPEGVLLRAQQKGQELERRLKGKLGGGSCSESLGEGEAVALRQALRSIRAVAAQG